MLASIQLQEGETYRRVVRNMGQMGEEGQQGDVTMGPEPNRQRKQTLEPDKPEDIVTHHLMIVVANNSNFIHNSSFTVPAGFTKKQKKRLVQTILNISRSVPTDSVEKGEILFCYKTT